MQPHPTVLVAIAPSTGAILAAAQNDAGGSLEDAEAGMAEMSAKFRAGGGVVEVKV